MGGDDKFVYKNGIVKYEASNKYKCKICTYNRSTSSSMTLREHLYSKLHQAVLAEYNKYFTDREDNIITCNLCYAALNVHQFYSHAQFHNLPPWVYPDLKEARFFENFMISSDNWGYFCYLCNENCFSWWQALQHTADVNHLELRRKMYTDFQLTQFDLGKFRIDYYREKRVFPLPGKMAWCWACDEKILMTNISVHCDGPSHLAAKRRAVELIEEDEKEKLSLEVVDESRDNCSDKLCNNVDVDDEDKAAASQTNSSDKSKSKESVTTTTKPPSKPGQRYACSICDVQLAEKEHIEIHLNGSSHKNYLEKLKTKFEREKNLDFYDLPIGIKINEADDSSFKFECNLCHSKISTFSDLLLHLQLYKHLMNTGNIYDESLLMGEYKIGRVLSTSLPNVFFCPSCLCTIKGDESIEWHLQEKDHRRSYKRFLDRTRDKLKQGIPEKDLKRARTTEEYPEEIKFIEDNGGDSYFWCTICFCKLLIPPSDCIFDEGRKVWQHVGGNHHRSIIRSRNKHSSSSSLSSPLGSLSLPSSSTNLSSKLVTTSVDDDDDSSTILPTEPILEVAGEEKLYCLPIEELMDVHVKDGILRAVTCKPCELYFDGELDDLAADWDRHLATHDHQQKAHLFSINKLKL